MLDILSKISYNPQNKLNNILKPVDDDLKMLEKSILESLSSNNQKLDQIMAYTLKSGGKRLRPSMVFLFSRALNQGMLLHQHFCLAEAVEMMHTASLIHDDVIDDAQTRRGFLTLHKKWDSKTAVVAGDFILSKALVKLVLAGGVSVEIFSHALEELCSGEIQQGDSAFKIISFEEYIQKSERKTAKLFVAGAECSAAITPGTNNLIIKAVREYSLNYGIAFQIVDDILNFTGSRSKLGKPAGNDLKNGILTAPVLFAIEEYSQKNDNRLKDLVKNKLRGKKDFEAAMNLIMASDGVQKAKELAEHFIAEAIRSLEPIENNIYKKALLDLAVYTLKRDF